MKKETIERIMHDYNMTFTDTCAEKIVKAINAENKANIEKVLNRCKRNSFNVDKFIPNMKVSCDAVLITDVDKNLKEVFKNEY